MAGAKVAPEKTEQAVPPNEAGREVLSYVQQQEKEADEAYAAAQGIPTEEEEQEVVDDKKEVEEPAKEVESKEPEKEAKGEVAAEDLTKGLSTENADKRISAAQNKMHDSNARAKTAEGERDRLKEQNDDLIKQLAAKPAAPAAEEAGKEAVKESPAVEADELQTSLNELEQEYPEIAKPMLKMMARQEVENKKLLDKVSTLEKAEETRTADAVVEKENTHLTALKEAHSDYKEISKEPLLDEWIEGLPAMEKAGAQAIRKDGSTSEVIALLTNFKKANGYELPADSKETPAKKSNSKIEKAKAAANPSFNKTKDVNLKEGQAPFSRREIDAMSMEEYAKNEPAIDEAMSKGFPPQ